ncbi:MAG: sigma 54-interacting transcriptional regulator, partial [Candidatus Aminicenantes bacterium]|nr:sigma 54-interacting transcriptional regulator [Candidatus Aminicenantes bacterium]
REIAEVDCLINLNGHCFSESALILNIKQLMIFPVSAELFFYLDSGSNESFREKEINELKTLGKIFSQLIKEIERNEKSPEGITGRSREADRIRSLVRKYAIVEEPVLLLGETGVGKNRVAELIHKYSGKKGDFVSVHTPGVAKDLFESQLFGHRKGSFTGATSDTTGFVAQAAGGTLFLDEIAELSPDTQAKLLRLIDTKSYTRLGDSVERRADVRIVAATNNDLRKLIEQRLFREDLYFRLNVLPIVIPPLRERRQDIPDLLAESANLLRRKKLNQAAVKVLVDYAWPGNIRELHSVLTRAGIEYEGEEIGPEIAEFFEKDFPSPVGTPENGKLAKIWQELRDGKTFWEAVWNPFINRELDRETVKSVLNRAYSENSHNFKNMLRALHIEDSKYQNFMSLMYKYQLTPKNKLLGLFNKPIG